MEVKFQNKCTYSKDVLLELAKHSRKKSLTVYCIGFIVLFTLLGIIYAFRNPGVGLIFFAGILILAVILAVSPGRQAKTLYQRNQALYHCEVVTQLYFYEDSFVFRNEQSGGELKLLYSQIKKVKESPRLFLLTLDGGNVIIVDKNGFLSGEAGSFPAFLKTVSI